LLLNHETIILLGLNRVVLVATVIYKYNVDSISVQAVILKHESSRLTFTFSDLDELEKADSMLNIKYGISGDRTTGAHSPVPVKPDNSEELLFKISLKLKRPVLDPCLAVGFLPFSTDCLRVGQLVNMKWRVERLKDLGEASLSGVSLQNIASFY
jgi:hypothetical protein